LFDNSPINVFENSPKTWDENEDRQLELCFQNMDQYCGKIVIINFMIFLVKKSKEMNFFNDFFNFFLLIEQICL